MEDNKKIIASCILETLDENVDINDRNHLFINEVNRANESLIYKLQELQMKI